MPFDFISKVMVVRPRQEVAFARQVGHMRCGISGKRMLWPFTRIRVVRIDDYRSLWTLEVCQVTLSVKSSVFGTVHTDWVVVVLDLAFVPLRTLWLGVVGCVSFQKDYLEPISASIVNKGVSVTVPQSMARLSCVSVVAVLIVLDYSISVVGKERGVSISGGTLRVSRMVSSTRVLLLCWHGTKNEVQVKI